MGVQVRPTGEFTHIHETFLISSNENNGESSGVDGRKVRWRSESESEKRFGQAIDGRFGGVE